MGLFNRSKKKDEPVADAAASEPVAVEDAQPEEKKPKKGLFARLKQGLRKTHAVMTTDLRDIFKEGRRVDQEFLDELLETLIKTDMGVAAAQEICDEVESQFKSRVVQEAEVIDTIKTKLKSLLAQPEEPIRFAESGPTVIMVCGVNGSGKTTSISKLANLFLSQGKKVVLGAGDTFRAAAVEQLTVWSQRLGCDIVTDEQGSDPASVAFQAVARAIETNADVCIVDTAGRLQTQTNLMKELEKIHRVLGKQIEEAPHEVILVLDATTGQNGISQAHHFTEAVECTGLVLAKLDGTAKGGVVVAIRKNVGLPVKYIGVGETPADLAAFVSDDFVDALFADDATAVA
ncbi:MAG: signal recognition particle-docking protein FtsY [Pirellulales bacterium]|nr:signal recognition particle-docking protein FtsY [Pirellulales bacterium]